jgi:hypothetical protein
MPTQTVRPGGHEKNIKGDGMCASLYREAYYVPSRGDQIQPSLTFPCPSLPLGMPNNAGRAGH